MELLTMKAPPAPPLGTTGAGLLREHATPRIFRRQSLIYSPGDAATHVCLVERGEVKLSRFTAEGRELTLEHLGAGEVFGEMEILLQRPRESQALARSECVVYQLERETLFALAQTHPDFGLWLTQRMGERQARLHERLETLLFKSASGKVAEVLLHLAEAYGEPTPRGTLINYAITHQEIGNLIATTRETVSYAFMEFRQCGLISTRQRKTIILDAARLGEVALA
ncbi:MAG TPA: Crp/Fnr family transcriptional regulator [bacterium]|nr:Crp/Fnr family transcriptional regulator [bacterium]